MVKSNLKEEERFAKEIQNFPCLYDKSNEGYKEKDRENTPGAQLGGVCTSEYTWLDLISCKYIV